MKKAKLVRFPAYKQIVGTDNRNHCGGSVVEVPWGVGFWRLFCVRCRKYFVEPKDR